MGKIDIQVSANSGVIDNIIKKIDELENKMISLKGTMKTLDSSNPEMETLKRELAEVRKQMEQYIEEARNLKQAKLDNDIATRKEIATLSEQSNNYERMAESIAAIIGNREQNIKRIIDETNAVAQLKEEQKKLDKAVKDGILSQDKATKQKVGLIAQEKIHKQNISELNQIVKNETKEFLAANSSMDGISQTLGRMRMVYRGLSEEARNSSFGRQLQADIVSLNTKLTTLDASIGNYQRNVGNYASGWNGLQNSMQQVIREAPTLAVSLNTFFLAISNNLPILADEIKKAKIAYKEYTDAVAAGNTNLKKVQPVWKQLIGTLFSWQSLLVVGISLLSVYGKDIANWVKEFIKGKEAINIFAEAQKKLNEAQLEGSKNAQEELIKLQLLRREAEDEKKDRNERLKAVAELQRLYPNYLGNIDKEKILTGQVSDVYNQLTTNIKNAAIAKAKFDKAVAIAKEKEEIEDSLAQLTGQTTNDENYINGVRKRIQLLEESRKKESELMSLAGAFENQVNFTGSIPKSDTQKKLEKIIETYEALQKKAKELERVSEGVNVSGLIDPDAARRAEEEAQRRAEQEKKAEEERLKLQQQLTDALLQDELKLQSARVALLEDGKEKRLAASKAEYEEQKAALQKEYDDRLAQYKKLNQEMPKEVSQTFVQRGITIREQREQRDDNIEKEYQKELLKRQQQLTDVFLADEEKKKEAIKRRYELEREWANKNLEGDQLNRILELIGSAEQKEMDNLNNELFKNSDIWEKLFDNLEKYTTSTLEDILKKAKQVNTEGWNPNDVKVWKEAINKADKEINKRNPFKGITKSWNNLIKAVKADDKDGIGATMTELSGGINEVSSMAINLGDSLAKAFSGDEAAEMNEDVKNVISSLASAGQLAAGIATGNVQGIVSGGMGLVSSVSKLFSGRAKKEESEAQRRAVVLSQTQELVNNILERRIKLLKEIKGIEYDTIKAQNDQLIKNQKALLDSQIRNSRAFLQKSGKNNNLSLGDLGIKSAKDAYEAVYGDLANTITDYLQNKGYKWEHYDELKKIADAYKDIIEAEEEFRQATEESFTGMNFDSLIDDISSLVGNMENGMKDVADSFEDMLGKAMQQAIKKDLADESLKNWYERFTSFMKDREGMSEQQVKDTINQLKKEYTDIVTGAREEWEAIEKDFGLDKLSGQQDASMKGFQAMSQDTGDELNGRFTALQAAGENIKEQNIVQTELFSDLSTKVSSLISIGANTQTIAEDVRSVLTNSFLQLVNIADNTESSAKTLKFIDEKMDKVARKIQNL